MRATLKLESASNLMRVGRKFLAMDSSSEISLLLMNFDWSSSIAYSLIFQSFSFRKSSISFLPRAASFLSCFPWFALGSVYLLSVISTLFLILGIAD